MTTFTCHTLATAPADSRDLLARAGKAWGFVPNLHAILAESPQALSGYVTLFELVGQSSLSPAEQQVAYLAINYVNECEYCMAGHSLLARMAKVPADAIAAARENAPIADARLEALRRFAHAVARKRGHVGDAAVDAFIAAGFTKRNVLEVVLAVATKTISNYTNHIVHTPAEAATAETAWVAPSRRNKVA